MDNYIIISKDGNQHRYNKSMFFFDPEVGVRILNPITYEFIYKIDKDDIEDIYCERVSEKTNEVEHTERVILEEYPTIRYVYIKKGKLEL